jgi:threonine/homoserine/homoserine lactone efflux protein
MSLHVWLGFAAFALLVSVVLGVTFIVSDALVFAAYGAIAHRAPVWLKSPRAARATSRVTGAAMLGVAARLAAER